MNWDVAGPVVEEHRLILRWVLTSSWFIAVTIKLLREALLVINQLLDRDTVAWLRLNLVFLVLLFLRVHDAGTGLWQQKAVHVKLVRPEISLLNLLEFIEMDWVLVQALALRDLAQVIVVEDSRHIEPEVEIVDWGPELHLKVAPHLLVEPMQVQDQVVLRLDASVLVTDLNFFPLFHGVDERYFTLFLELIVLKALDPIVIREDGLNCIFLHVADDDVEVLKLTRERSKADRVEVDHLVTHVLEHAIEAQIVVLAQTELKEGHRLLLKVIDFSQFVVQEATEELDVALL